MGKSNKVKPRLLKGMQDGWPELALARSNAIRAIEDVCRQFAFLPFDTPAMEAREALVGQDPTPGQLKSIFHFVNHDDEEVGLRYELTASLARAFSQYQLEIQRPFRRYQYGQVWRWDKPEPGRFREFLQFDIDTVGSSSMAADAEVIAVLGNTLDALGITGFLIKLSNRKLLNALGQKAGIDPVKARDIYRVIDKLDKFDRDRIRQEFGPGLVDQSGDPIQGLGLSESEIKTIDAFLDLPNEGNAEGSLSALREFFDGNELAQQGITELGQVLEFAEAFGVEPGTLRLDLHLARGLGYYSGPIFEAVLTDIPEFGSIFGGGRYDQLVERFLGEGQGVPAVGASIGVDRLLAALEAQGRVSGERPGAEVLVTVMDKARMQDYVELTRSLREAGIRAELYLGGGNLGKQMKYADRLSIPLAIVIGENEFEKGEVAVKDLDLGRKLAEQAESREEWSEQKQQETVPRNVLATYLLDKLVR